MKELNINQCKYCLIRDECSLQDEFVAYAKALQEVKQPQDIFQTVAYCQKYLLDTKEFMKGIHK